VNTKLTLAIDKAIIEEAKAYASSSGSSLSAVIEEYLKAITVPKKKTQVQLNEEVSLVLGSVTINEERSYKELRDEAVTDKYLKGIKLF
jgi:hypothetical protein